MLLGDAVIDQSFTSFWRLQISTLEKHMRHVLDFPVVFPAVSTSSFVSESDIDKEEQTKALPFNNRWNNAYTISPCMCTP